MMVKVMVEVVVIVEMTVMMVEVVVMGPER